MGVLAASLRPVQGMSLSPLSSAAVRLIRQQWEPRNAVPKRKKGGGRGDGVRTGGGGGGGGGGGERDASPSGC